MADRSVELRIEESTQEDLNELVELQVQVLALHHRLDPVRYFEPDRDAIRDWIAGSAERESRCLVARIGGRAVGYVSFKPQETPANPFVKQRRAIYVDQLAVLEQERGRGVGRALVGEVAKLAAGEGFEVVALDTHVDNRDAQRFFERLGYRRSHERRLRVLEPGTE